jgi:hypothetical protein
MFQMQRMHKTLTQKSKTYGVHGSTYWLHAALILLVDKSGKNVFLLDVSQFNEKMLIYKSFLEIYEARPQSKFPTRPTASKPYIAQSDCAYVIELWCSMAHALTVLPAFSQ